MDYNNIEEVYTPPNLKILTLSFNKVNASHIDYLCMNLRKSPQLEETDLSFNEVRKAPNYKMKLLSSNPKLKSIDGLKVTKIDRDMAN